MNQHNYPMTQAGFHALKKELKHLENTKRPQATKRIKHARDFCDFNEDSEYKAALDDLASIEKRIAMIQYKLQNADISFKLDNDFIEVGDTVTFQNIEDQTVETYTIVGSEETDPDTEIISYQAPVAQALLYAKVNEIVSISAPHGNKNIKIIEIS